MPSIEITREERQGTKRFNAEFIRCIKALMKRDVHPTPENMFAFFRDHPGDFPHISRIRMLGKEDLLKVYIYLHGKLRSSIKRKEPDAEGEATRRTILDPGTGRPFEE